MKLSTALSLVPALLVALGGAAALAQDEEAPVPGAPAPGDTTATRAAEDALEYDDYTVKAYSLTFFGGNFSGATYLDLPERGPKTVVDIGIGDELGPAGVRAYDGSVLIESRAVGSDGYLIWDAAQKEIKSGPAFGARIGVYISDNFHLDIAGTYAEGKSVTSMLYTGPNRPSRNLAKNTRYVLDEDAGFVMYKGGLGLAYDAVPATVWGFVPRLGFGLGGIINRFSELDDITSLYLEGSFGLSRSFGDRLSLVAQADVTNFAFQVEELGYANMTNYATLTVGLSWFIDVLPQDVRARRLAAQQED